MQSRNFFIRRLLLLFMHIRDVYHSILEVYSPLAKKCFLGIGREDPEALTKNTLFYAWRNRIPSGEIIPLLATLKDLTPQPSARHLFLGMEYVLDHLHDYPTDKDDLGCMIRLFTPAAQTDQPDTIAEHACRLMRETRTYEFTSQQIFELAHAARAYGNHEPEHACLLGYTISAAMEHLAEERGGPEIIDLDLVHRLLPRAKDYLIAFGRNEPQGHEILSSAMRFIGLAKWRSHINKTSFNDELEYAIGQTPRPLINRLRQALSDFLLDC